MVDTLSEILSSPSGDISFLHFFLIIGISYLGGILASFTPCVYPMIPITISVIGGTTKPKDGNEWRYLAIRSTTYVLGMAIVYAFLGILAALTGKIFGTFTNTVGWYLTLGCVLTLAALIMLDVLSFQPNVWLEKLKGTRKQSTQTGQTSLIGAFLLGATSGLVAAPCTTPILTALLAYIANTQSIGMGMSLMISFSLGLGTILLLIAFFTGTLQLFPKSGRWLNTVKLVSGLILLGFANYLFFLAGSMGSL